MNHTQYVVVQLLAHAKQRKSSNILMLIAHIVKDLNIAQLLPSCPITWQIS